MWGGGVLPDDLEALETQTYLAMVEHLMEVQEARRRR